MLVAGWGWASAAPASFPDWLGGRPDTSFKSERCGVYEWFLARADEQSEGLASQPGLARKRVINLANKLVEQHRVAPRQVYEGRVKYLVFSDAGPFHFGFRITAEGLEGLLQEACGE